MTVCHCLSSFKETVRHFWMTSHQQGTESPSEDGNQTTVGLYVIIWVFNDTVLQPFVKQVNEFFRQLFYFEDTSHTLSESGADQCGRLLLARCCTSAPCCPLVGKYSVNTPTACTVRYFQIGANMRGFVCVIRTCSYVKINNRYEILGV